MDRIALQEDYKYEFADMTIVSTTDSDFNPILKITTDEGNVIVLPFQRDEVIVKSTVDK
ncbi:hypothetical protein [Bacteroides sp.]|uniref:hypothetical protein n=1 Tax=Bacteroides sp. TaxID=29523 RepID=UPI00261A2A86|nr:hypothetical protein [Bacteroides sp.]MDD3040357.1 hypothetical protein [Bacteroides sp.]